MPAKIPIVLVTGFLGSGKTTLLRRIADKNPQWRMIFLVNEFADTGIDALTLQTTGRPTQSVVGGSLFCECKAGEFVRVMRDTVLVQHRDEALDAIVIETSGIADPQAIGQLMSLYGLSDHFEIRRIICVVAVKRFLKLLENLPAVRAQVRTADLVVINKTDLAGMGQIQAVESAIRSENPIAEIVLSEHCGIDFDMGTTVRALPHGPLTTCEANPFCTETISWPEDRAIDAAKAWLEELPAWILRVKGSLRTSAGYFRVERTVDTLEVTPTQASAPAHLILIAHEDHEAELQAVCQALGKKKPTQAPYAILACDVFEEELQHLGGSNPPWAALGQLPMGLHDQPDHLRAQVQTTIAGIESNPAIETIALAYGRCGNGLLGVKAERCQLILPQAHDCISILLGSCERHAAILKENPGSYFFSPGWVRGKRVPGPDRESYLRELYAERYADDPDMIDDLVEADSDTFAQHNCAAYVAITDNSAAADYCRNCALHLGWSHWQLEGDPSFLDDLIHARWDDSRFLRIPPGHCIAADSEGQLYAQPSHP
jgi:G3E family GTPase